MRECLRVNVIDGSDVVKAVAAAEVAVVVEEERFHLSRKANHATELADAAALPGFHRRCDHIMIIKSIVNTQNREGER